jgi:hypothetical protein
MIDTMTDRPAGDAVRQFADGSMVVADANKFSGLGRTKLYELMESGALPYAKVHGRRLIARRSLVEFLAKHAASAADAQPA